MLNKAIARVVAITGRRPGAQELDLEIEGRISRAVNYTQLTGELEPGDEVIVNTTAVDLGLGTGGVHFVIEAPGRKPQPARPEAGARGPQPRPGHIMKLRYTPLQHSVLSVEEEASPHREAIETFESLDATPVVICELHSQLAPVFAAAKASSADPIRIGYVMTDTAALPAAFSKLIPALKERHLLDFVITCGQAFGGDYEAVNLYSALAAAKAALGADIVAVAQGPGNVGTGTQLGHGGVEVGVAANAVHSLAGEPIVAPRMSFADPRPRHRGLSHHSIAVLSKITLAPVVVALPALSGEERAAIDRQLESAGIELKGHRLEFVETEPVRAAIEKHRDMMHTMGRGYREDAVFFLASGCAGFAALRRLRSQAV
jgi:hypothetical protein